MGDKHTTNLELIFKRLQEMTPEEARKATETILSEDKPVADGLEDFTIDCGI